MSRTALEDRPGLGIGPCASAEILTRAVSRSGRSQRPHARLAAAAAAFAAATLIAAALLPGALAAQSRSRSRTPAPAPPAGMAEGLRWSLSRAPLRTSGVGALVVSLQDGRTIFESGADRALMPASTMKVMTTAAILDRLGPDWMYRTEFRALAPPVGGVIAGDLYVKGACAPDMVVERFPELAQAILAAGIREIDGDIVADLEYLDGEERPPEWPGRGNRNPYAAPIAALAANFSTLRVTVLPGPKPGARASVVLEPPTDDVTLSISARTMPSGRTALRAARSDESDPQGGTRNRISVSGKIPKRVVLWETFVPIEEPAQVAVSAIRRALTDAGITVKGGSRLGVMPEGSVPVYVLSSKPLSDIVFDTNKNSNNFMSEMLQRTLGAEVYGAPATREKGARAIADFLRTCGVDPSELALTDGSGLSRSNRLSASALVRVLVRMYQAPDAGAALYNSFPIGGVDGTLRSRMPGLARGRVRAKTGRINGVSTLAGYVEDTREGPVAFAFLVNGADNGRAVRALDSLCDILCRP